MCRPYLLLSHVTNPPIHGLENLGVTDFLLLLSIDMLGAWLKAILKVVGPEDIIPIEYEASCRCEHAWSKKGRQT
jgi:hypothetical protein